ncbi:MAG: PA14 domain-containing protein [Limisphaerales bacterium]
MSNSMLRLSSRWLGGVALGAGLAFSASTQAADVFAPGVMKVEFFTGLDGVDIYTLLDSAKYQNNQPDEVRYVTSFITPNGYGDNYGARVSGFITPAVSGDYDFFIRADDQAQLYLSTDDNPANAQVIAQELASCCQAFQEPGVEETTAAPVTMVANRRYAVYLVMKEGGGGDWSEVAWRKTDDTTAAGNLRPMAGSVIGAFAPAGTVQIDDQPDAVSTIEGVYASFSVATSYTGVSAPAYQWRKNGADIAGANSASYTTPLLTLADNGAKYTVKVNVPGAEVISAEAVLTVAADTIPPKVVSVAGIKTSNGGIEVGVIFDESVDPASVVAANFALGSGTISAVRHVPNSSGKSSLEDGAVLTTTGLTQGSTYALTISGVKDVKGNTMAATTLPFTISKMTWAALGTQPDAFPAGAIAVADDGFNVNSGGNAFWSTNDDVTFVYEEVTGDFDKVVRVEYQDPSSQWARTGIHARDSLIGTGTEAARYQNTHVNPTIKADGGASNFSYETNRRLSTGAETSGSGGGGTPQYPNAWVRLRRAGDVMHMYRSDNATTWIQLGISDFNPADGSNESGPLPAKMYVGPVFGPENGNLTEEFRDNWAAVFRDYGDYEPNKARGSQTYSIGVNFGSEEPNGVGSWMGPTEIAGADPIAQSNWNNVSGPNSDESGPITLKADVAGAAQNTTATVEWTCPNTWSSTGRGEENTALTGSDRQLMVGYLDTGNATTTLVTVKNLPSQLTGGTGYDLVVYTLGGVAGRGGGYRVTDVNGTEIKPVVLASSAPNPTSLTKVTPTDPAVHAAGTYVVFSGLKANEFILEGSTENNWGLTGTPRAGINAIQIVSPSGAVDAAKPEIAIARTATGATITFKGTLQKASAVTGPYTDVAGATSPMNVSPTDAQAYYRTR